MATVDISELSNEIAKTLTDEYADAQDEINIAAEDTAKELCANLKADSPKRKNSGKYAKGWTVTRDGNTFIIHNKTRPYLTHILERGHMNRNGSRTSGQPHIAPNEEKAVLDFTGKVEKILEGGG